MWCVYPCKLVYNYCIHIIIAEKKTWLSALESIFSLLFLFFFWKKSCILLESYDYNVSREGERKRAIIAPVTGWMYLQQQRSIFSLDYLSWTNYLFFFPIFYFSLSPIFPIYCENKFCCCATKCLVGFFSLFGCFSW